MGDPRGFYQIEREVAPYRDVAERVKQYAELAEAMPIEKLRQQGARCMDCGIPFCHSSFGCPLGNLIPTWNDLVFHDDWEQAIEALHSTNNFPEFTGRVCPAPCETACTLGINAPAVTIKQIEMNIIDQAWERGLVKPLPPQQETGKKVAVVGAGPAGLVVAQQLRRAGHQVTLYERDSVAGGLLAVGIPDFKMEKRLVNRRVEQMEAEGVVFKLGVEVGRDIDATKLREENDALVLCIGSTTPRDLPIAGREFSGIHFAMDFLRQQNARVRGESVPADQEILATDKHVVVIGGGDTGADCVGTSVRQGAKRISQLEILPKPPGERPDAHPWPQWPFTLTVSTSHMEAEALAEGSRQWCINTRRFNGEDGRVTALEAEKVEWQPNPEGGRPIMKPVADSQFELKADLVLLAMGFLHPEQPILEQLGLEKDERGNVKAPLGRQQTNVDNVFAAGDCRRGQSLVVWAMAEGRDVAYDVDEYLMGESCLRRATPRENAVAWNV